MPATWLANCGRPVDWVREEPSTIPGCGPITVSNAAVPCDRTTHAARGASESTGRATAPHGRKERMLIGTCLCPLLEGWSLSACVEVTAHQQMPFGSAADAECSGKSLTGKPANPDHGDHGPRRSGVSSGCGGAGSGSTPGSCTGGKTGSVGWPGGTSLTGLGTSPGLGRGGLAGLGVWEFMDIYPSNRVACVHHARMRGCHA